MSDPVQGPADDSASDPPLGAELTAGAMLRRARDAAGLHIGALAVSLKVPVKKLEALEADQFDQLPDTVFVRGLAASVCRALKIDADPVLMRLPQQSAPKLPVKARAGQASFDKPGMGWRLPLLSRLPRPVLVTAATLVVAALALFFTPALERSGRAVVAGGVAVSPAAEPAAAVPAAASPAAASPEVASAPVVAASVLAAAASVAPTASASVVEHKAQAPDAGTVAFRARAASWVEVTDANGVVQLRKTLASGESAGASGAMPLTVVVGRVDVTDVTVRGQAFDLSTVTRDNVARFQVK